MPPHVAAEGLTGGELGAAYRALMDSRLEACMEGIHAQLNGPLVESNRLEFPGEDRRPVLLVTRAMPAQSLVGGETPIACLALVGDGGYGLELPLFGLLCRMSLGEEYEAIRHVLLLLLLGSAPREFSQRRHGRRNPLPLTALSLHNSRCAVVAGDLGSDAFLRSFHWTYGRGYQNCLHLEDTTVKRKHKSSEISTQKWRIINKKKSPKRDPGSGRQLKLAQMWCFLVRNEGETWSEGWRMAVC
ncbi:hypothetical protein HPP92_027472 [Vanilla planifolia]|uniref:Uncharacterized protein n=1 Tax=Vanilla planifolia TaxID=51239 RepID=A0A835PCD3_VANPL|nr:hypothetical protein HPP92_027472 [Vanilla planifolia]